MVTTESMTDLPLPRIGQAIRAVLDDLYLLPVAYGRSDVVSKTRGRCHQGTHDEARAFIDARCAEAAVRVMREPSPGITKALGFGIYDDLPTEQIWENCIDAMLSETQP